MADNDRTRQENNAELNKMLTTLASIVGKNLTVSAQKFYVEQLSKYALEMLRPIFTSYTNAGRWPSIDDIKSRMGILQEESDQVEPEGQGWSKELSTVPIGSLWTLEIFARAPNHADRKAFDEFMVERISELKMMGFTIRGIDHMVITEPVKLASTGDFVKRPRCKALVYAEKTSEPLQVATYNEAVTLIDNPEN